MPAPAEYVFAYGSLAALSPDAPAGFLADVRGMRRSWGVAMDNRVDRPGYKCYVEDSGRRPAVFVCFLDLEAAGGCAVNGLCLPVDRGRLAALDRRERNYDRIDVSAHVVPRDGGVADADIRVWAYRGSASGRARFREGVAAGSAVIHDGYLAAVRAAFASLGDAEWQACAPSLEPAGLPVVALQRREL